MKRSSYFTVSAICGLGLISPFGLTSAAAQSEASDAPQAMLVLDGSGSMWGQLEGRHKIEIARDVISETVADWDADTELGLLAYGHNREGDCTDIELLISPGRLDADEFSTQARAVNPKGKTPLSAAVMQAAEAMDYKDRKTTVILVSDGKETCDLDPCEIGRSLESANVDFTAHVIGFDVSKEDSVGLRCLAAETGGAYLDAQNAKGLQSAFQQTRDIVTDDEQIEIALASIEVPVEVFAGAAFDAEWQGPKNVSDYLSINSEDDTDAFRTTYIGADTVLSPTALTAPEEAGTYLVHYRLKDGTSLASDRLIVSLPEATVDAPDSVVAGAEYSVAWTGPANEFDFLRTINLQGEPMHRFESLGDAGGEPVTLVAPVEPGEYEIRYVTMSKNVLAQDTITVTESEATVLAPGSIDAGAFFEVEWTGPQNKIDRLRILDNNGERLNNFLFVEREDPSLPATMTAPLDAGEYFIAYDASSNRIVTKQAITVLPVTAMIDGPTRVAAGGEYQVTWFGPNYKGDSIYTFTSEGKDARQYVIFRDNNPLAPITLEAPKTPGKYELRYRLKGKKVIATHRFIVE